MVKDAVITIKDFLDIFYKNIGNEKSDSIFEKQFDYINLALDNFTPSKYREEIASQMFKFVLDLIHQTPAEEKNRLVILKSKLPLFARADEDKMILLKWREGNFDLLKEHPMTIGQEWSAVVKAFTLKQLSIEEKEKLFESQKEKDNSDTAKLKRFTCDALKANKEDFLQFYEGFKDPNSEHSISVKTAISGGWKSSVHSDKLL